MDNIKIKVSDNMTNYSGMYTNENTMLRIPKTLRQYLGLEVGQQFEIIAVNKEPVALQIGTAYQADTDVDDNICYVTRQIFEQINIEGTDDYNVVPVKNITLGCDPEFFLVDKHTKKVLRAYNFFKKWGEIGHDGILAEIRPKPSKTAEGLTDNIYKLICNTRKILNHNNLYDPERIVMYAASGYQSATAGFHLHFGLPNTILGKTPNNLKLMQQIVKIMDYYVGLPAIIIEGETDANRRANVFVNYGKPSDFRLDNRTLEYRVAGGNILRHPELTKGLIALGATVTEDIISRVKTCTNGFKHLYWTHRDERFKELYPDVLSISDTYKLMCSPNVDNAKKYLDNIYNGISKMIGFNERYKAINTFFNNIETSNQYNNNIEYNWRKFYERQTTKVYQS